MKTTNRTSRRRFLRGAGVALALPWLESLPLLAQDGAVSVAANANKPPIRFAHIFFSNGVEPAHWWAKGDGKDMEFGPGQNEFALRRDGQFGPERDPRRDVF
jgi:hypothetical protein